MNYKYYHLVLQNHRHHFVRYEKNVRLVAATPKTHLDHILPRSEALREHSESTKPGAPPPEVIALKVYDTHVVRWRRDGTVCFDGTEWFKSPVTQRIVDQYANLRVWGSPRGYTSVTWPNGVEQAVEGPGQVFDAKTGRRLDRRLPRMPRTQQDNPHGRASFATASIVAAYRQHKIVWSRPLQYYVRRARRPGAQGSHLKEAYKLLRGLHLQDGPFWKWANYAHPMWDGGAVLDAVVAEEQVQGLLLLSHPEAQHLRRKPRTIAARAERAELAMGGLLDGLHMPYAAVCRHPTVADQQAALRSRLRTAFEEVV